MSGVSTDHPPVYADSARLLHCGDRVLDLSSCQVMGVLNVTPDSFSDGGALHVGGSLDPDAVLTKVEQMVRAGASVIDVGGESTRPGAAVVSLQEELDRVVPVVAAIAARFDVIISVDTSSPLVMKAAVSEGAGLINDVRALEREGALQMAASLGVPVCLMHMQGAPDTMQDNPHYADVVVEVAEYLAARARAATAAGIPPSSILVDPGFGFGKALDHNLMLLNQLRRIVDLGFPVLAGLSRKSMIGKILGRDTSDRLAASVALAVMAAERGALIVRCHDVRETVDAMTMLHYVKQEQFIV